MAMVWLTWAHGWLSAGTPEIDNYYSIVFVDFSESLACIILFIFAFHSDFQDSPI